MADDLTPEAVLADARSATGLDDFGDESFREPMERLVFALRDEALLTEMGRGYLRDRVVSTLVTRLRFEQTLLEHPEILDEEIGAPVVICGLPRTGTTMLHRVIAEDPSFDSVKWYEGRFPAPFEGWKPGEPDARIPAAEREVAMTVESSPELMAIHPFDAHSPDEEIMLLEQSFMSRLPESYCHIPEFSAWLEALDQLPGYRYLVKLLQYLQWQHRLQGRARPHWVLKAPHHLAFLPQLFTVFPDATIVQTHREPAETIPSICSMHLHLNHMTSRDPDAAAIGAHWNGKWSMSMERCIDFRDAGHDDRFVDLWYLDSVRDPVSVVRKVYAFLGKQLTEIAEEKMQQWAEDNARDKRARHEYSLAQFGFTEESMARDYLRYRERYVLPYAGD